jgi:alpha-1,6-mannosyltransferase
MPNDHAARRASPLHANLALATLGCIALILYLKGIHDQGTQRILTFTAGAVAQMGPYFLASLLIVRFAVPARSTLAIGLVFAAAFRLVALQSDTYLSTDLYRYVWDGRMQAAGVNPYRYIPSDPKLEKYRDEKIYPHINRKTYAVTIYPPVAEMTFLAMTRISESPRWVRLLMVFFDALTIYLLIRLLTAFGLPAQRVLLYAWNPLPIWEFASGGHIDALLLALLATVLLLHRRGRVIATAATLAAATLVKLFPVVLFPALYRRWRYGWKMPVVFVGVCVAAYLPYWLTYSMRGTLGFLPAYTSEEGIQSGDRFFLMSLLPSEWMRRVHLPLYPVFVVLTLVLLGSAAAWAFWKPETDDRSILRRCLCLATIFTAVLSPGYPWYFCWLAPFLVVLPYPWLFWLTVSPFVLYLNWIHYESSDIFLLNSFIYFPAAVLALLAGTPSGVRWVGGRVPGVAARRLTPG